VGYGNTVGDGNNVKLNKTVLTVYKIRIKISPHSSLLLPLNSKFHMEEAPHWLGRLIVYTYLKSFDRLVK
jgi:hypothetical protein